MKSTKNAIVVPAVALLCITILSGSAPVKAQKDQKPVPVPVSLLTRTTTRHENHRLSYGGTVTVSAAPAGSIIIEGWQRSEVDISAAIELQAGSVPDLDLLAAVNTFVVDEDTNHIRILTTGTHDRAFMKRMAKKFPKGLIGLPWKIDYYIKVPALTDLSIDAGNGPIKLSGVEGTIRLNALNSIADLSLTGGIFQAIFQSGTVNVNIPTRGWHGPGAEIKLASGNLNVDLMPGFSGDVNAEVLRIGEVRNTFPNLEPSARNGITSRAVKARAGNGGATLMFTVGDGIIQIRQSKQ